MVVRNHRRRVMTAHVIEGAQRMVGPSDDDDRLSARKLAGDVIAWINEGVDAPHYLPCPPEHRTTLEIPDPWVDVPRRGDRGCLRQRRVCMITGDDLGERIWHGRGTSEYFPDANSVAISLKVLHRPQCENATLILGRTMWERTLF